MGTLFVLVTFFFILSIDECFRIFWFSNILKDTKDLESKREREISFESVFCHLFFFAMFNLTLSFLLL